MISQFSPPTVRASTYSNFVEIFPASSLISVVVLVSSLVVCCTLEIVFFVPSTVDSTVFNLLLMSVSFLVNDSMDCLKPFAVCSDFVTRSVSFPCSFCTFDTEVFIPLIVVSISTVF